MAAVAWRDWFGDPVLCQLLLRVLPDGTQLGDLSTQAQTLATQCLQDPEAQLPR